MIKRLSIISFILLCFSICSIQANETIQVKLSSGHNKETYEVKSCNITVELQEKSNSSMPVIKIEIENTDRENFISLFDKGYDKKALKRHGYKFHKKFPVGNGLNEVVPFKELKAPIKIGPNSQDRISNIELEENGTKEVRLPIYVSQYKKKSLFSKEKWIFRELEEVTLEIEVSLRPDENQLRIAEKCRLFLEEYEDIVICKNKRHRPSLEEQKEEYQKRLDSLKFQIDSIIDRNYWKYKDDKSNIFNVYRERLNSLNLDEKVKDCGKHAVYHKCSYCKSTLQEIRHMLDDIYQQIDTDRVKKSDVIRKASTMFDCAKRRRDWKKSKHNMHITRIYNRIEQSK